MSCSGYRGPPRLRPLVWRICKKFIVVFLSETPPGKPHGAALESEASSAAPRRGLPYGSFGRRRLCLRLGRGPGAARRRDHHRQERRDGLRDGRRRRTGDHRRQGSEQVTTLAVMPSALTASPAPAAATALLAVSLAAIPAGDTVCWLSVVPTWPASTRPALTA